MKKLLMIGLLLTGIVAPLKAISNQINYQGTLKQKGVPVNGTRNIRFRFVDASGADIPGTTPINMANVSVTQGLFAVQLTLSPTVDWQSYSPYIEVSIEGQVLTPNQPLTSNLYSMVAQTVSNGAITPAKITTGYGLIPSGTILPFAGVVAPSGYLLCDGSSVSRITYGALFAALGVSWGQGDGSSTFNLPDLRGRAPVGAGQGDGLTNRTIGQTFGEETHRLTTAEMPSHNHGVVDPGHSHSPGTSQYFIGQNASQNVFGLGSGSSTGSVSTTSNNTTGISIQSSGGNVSHNVMQPSAVVNFIIKI